MQPNPQGWEIVCVEGGVWFRLAKYPGLEVVVTVDGGEVVGFEVHAQGAERSFPLDRGEYGPHELPPPPDPVEPPPITAELVRELPFGKLARFARSSLGVRARWSDEGFEELAGWGSETADELKKRAQKQARSRPRDKGDLYYAKLAMAYEDWTATAQTLKALANEQKVYNVNTLRSQLQEARRRQMLTPALPGRANGWATDKAKRLLEEEGDVEIPRDQALVAALEASVKD